MDIKITLIGLMILVTSIAFGQKAVINDETNNNPLIAYSQDFGNVNQGLPFQVNQVLSFQTDKTIVKEILSKSGMDSQLRFDSAVWYQMDTTKNQWVYDWKYKQEYDAKGNEILFVSNTWDEARGKWIGNLKHEFEYNAEGQNTILVSHQWDKTKDDWRKYWKSEYKYDTKGNQILSVGYELNESTNQWILYNKVETEYDATGNKILDKNFEWNGTTMQWTNNRKVEYQNDDKGKMTFWISYNLETTTNKWIADWKAEYVYDAYGNNILELDYILDKTTGQLKVMYKYVSLYDSKGNEIEYSQYAIDNITNQLKEGWKFKYGYTANGEITNNFGYDWSDANNDWHISPRMKAIYYYEGQNFSSANQIKSEIIRLYPNPVSENLSFSISDTNELVTFELFDLQGNRLISKKVNTADKISVKDLKSGIYLYNFNIGSKRQTGKLIIE